MIKDSDDESEEMIKAKGLINRIMTRDLYKIIKSNGNEWYSQDFCGSLDFQESFKAFLKDQEFINEEIGIIKIKIPSGEGNINPEVGFYDENYCMTSININQTIDEDQNNVKYAFICKVSDEILMNNSEKIVHKFLQLPFVNGARF